MINPEETISNLKGKLKPLIGYSFGFDMASRSPMKYVLSCGYCSSAITNGEEVNIINLYDDYWIYMNITFNPYEEIVKRGPTKTNYNIMFSLSLFHGEYVDQKKQLFRAEWDNYEKDESLHPQPHWHFYINEEENKTSTFNETIEDEDIGFYQSLKNENKEFQKMHFAMNGQWSANEGHMHRIKESDSFVEWVFGLVDHIYTQLKYIDK